MAARSPRTTCGPALPSLPCGGHGARRVGRRAGSARRVGPSFRAARSWLPPPTGRRPGGVTPSRRRTGPAQFAGLAVLEGVRRRSADSAPAAVGSGAVGPARSRLPEWWWLCCSAYVSWRWIRITIVWQAKRGPSRMRFCWSDTHQSEARPTVVPWAPTRSSAKFANSRHDSRSAYHNVDARIFRQPAFVFMFCIRCLHTDDS